MNINDDRFGNIRKEGRKNLVSGRKYTALRLLTGKWVIGSQLNLDLSRVMDEVFLLSPGPQIRTVQGDSC